MDTGADQGQASHPLPAQDAPSLLMTLGSSSWNTLPESVAFYEQLAGCNYYFVAAFTVSLYRRLQARPFSYISLDFEGVRIRLAFVYIR